jgi:hypothetical protein
LESPYPPLIHAEILNMDRMVGARSRKPLSAYVLGMRTLDTTVKNDKHTPFFRANTSEHVGPVR